MTLSLATWLLAPALLVLPQPAAARWPARTAAVAAVVVGLANLLEDGLGVEAAGIGFGLGTAVLLLGCVAMALACLIWPPRWAAPVPAATAVGLLLLESGGGLLVLAAWASLLGGSRESECAVTGCLSHLRAAAQPAQAGVGPEEALRFGDVLSAGHRGPFSRRLCRNDPAGNLCLFD